MRLLFGKNKPTRTTENIEIRLSHLMISPPPAQNIMTRRDNKQNEREKENNGKKIGTFKG